MSRFSSAIATDQRPREALRQATDAAGTKLGVTPNLACVFVAGRYGRGLAGLGGELRDLVPDATVFGAVGSDGVLGSGVEVQRGVAVSVLLGTGAAPRAVRLWHDEPAETFIGAETLGSAETLVVVADPFTVSVPDLLVQLAQSHPALRVIGGLSGGQRPGQAMLWADGETYADGGVGLAFEAGAASCVVSQGCRPIGPELTVTEAESNLIVSLAGEPAVEKLREVFRALDAEDRARASAGLLIGFVADANVPDYEAGNFLVRPVLGADHERNSVIVADRPRVGQVVRFHVRDELAATRELTLLVERTRSGRAHEGALLFCCNGRGMNMFDAPDHDAAIFARQGVATAGLFCQGEIGPVGRRNALHAFTATAAMLR